MRRLLIITLVMTLGGAGIAEAAGTAAMTLTPNKASAPSTASVSITGLSGFSGLPSSIDLLLQPGFTSSAKSVKTLCSASQSSSNSCPPASQIGTGSVGISFFGSSVMVPITLFLGEPLQAGDIASVILSGSYLGSSLTLSGRLFTPAQGGLEILLSSSSASVPVTLASLAITVQASQTTTTTVKTTVTRFVFRGKGKRRHKHKVKKTVTKTLTTAYSLITNPSMCTGTWIGAATLTYASGTNTLPLNAACTP